MSREVELLMLQLSYNSSINCAEYMHTMNAGLDCNFGFNHGTRYCLSCDAGVLSISVI